MIDVHWLYRKEALQVIEDRLTITQKALETREIPPNVDGVSRDHVIKVICGKGNNSANGIGVNKFAARDWLDKNDFDYYANMDWGNFIVRLLAPA